MQAIMIAPCGINCSVCRAHLRDNNKCHGCNSKDNIIVHCMHCRIRNCYELKKSKSTFCYQCRNFPCIMIKKLDIRYRTRYGISVIDNLEYIKAHGKRKFLEQQEKAFVKPCGILCMHDKRIYPLRS